LRTTPLALAIAGAALALAPAAQAASAPVSTLRTEGFGRVLTTPSKQAVYFWNQERDGRVRCTGACAVAWPPVLVKPGARVPTRLSGIPGRFGVVRRPDGSRQLTRNRLPLYTYANERPRQVLCDNVNGWFVVRLSG
jgi:predicted lipoprotein with Yx(FWY)xxD motif